MVDETSLVSAVLESLGRAGFPARAVSIEHLGELRGELDGHRKRGLLDPALERRYLGGFDFDPHRELPSARTLIVAAAPQPSLLVEFTRRGRSFEVVVPPTYVSHTDGQARERIDAVLRPAGCRAAPARLPEKLLLVRSGLGRYGKNNIVFVEGLGSFHRPVVFFTDAGPAPDGWQEPRMLERCEHCIACREKCPTGAIPTDRFLLRAERCLTFHNESRDPFPEWIDPGWHSCLIGCMVCQDVCPENQPFVRQGLRTVTFSEEETDAILRRTERDALAGEINSKLERIDMLGYYDRLPRNLGVLLPGPG